MRTLVYGAGAVGGTVGAWLAGSGQGVTFYARPQTAALLNEQGLQLYAIDQPPRAARTVRVRAVADLGDAPDVDAVVLAVKTYDLEPAALALRARFGPAITVIALQNGIENQDVLPRHFARVVYGVVCYNAWRDAPDLLGYQSRGPVVLGVIDPAASAARDAVVQAFSRALRCRAEARIADAVKCKMALNLANSVTTLVGLGVRPIRDVGALQRCVTRVLHEGIGILQAGGIREVRLENTPDWRTIRLTRALPGPLATAIFRRRLARIRMSSMGQDVYVQHRGTTELEALNGWFVRQAAALGCDAPFNRALYRVTRDWLAQPEPRPIDEAELWQRLCAG